jgi:hypothetical protein
MKVISFTDRYWKGDGLFLDMKKDFPHRKKARELYSRIDDMSDLSLRNFVFLKKYSPEIYEIWKRVFHFSDKFTPAETLTAIKYFMRLKLFSLDFLEKQEDDLKLREDSEDLVRKILSIPNFFMSGVKISFDIDKFWELVPQRSTSELLYYTVAYYCNAKRIKKRFPDIKKMAVEIFEKDTFLITSTSCEMDIETLDNPEDKSLKGIVENMFEVYDYNGYNYGARKDSGKSDFWFAWLA